MKNILRKGLFITFLIFFIYINPLLESREIALILEGGKADCSSNLEEGNVFDLHLKMHFSKKLVFQSAIEHFTYNYTFTRWGNLLTLVLSKIVVTDFNIGLGFYHNIFSIKKTIFPYIGLSSMLHILQSNVKREDGYSGLLPPNVKPYEHSAKFVPGISVNAGIKAVPFNLPFYVFGEAVWFAVPGWDEYLIGYSDRNYFITQSLKAGISFILRP